MKTLICLVLAFLLLTCESVSITRSHSRLHKRFQKSHHLNKKHHQKNIEHGHIRLLSVKNLVKRLRIRAHAKLKAKTQIALNFMYQFGLQEKIFDDPSVDAEANMLWAQLQKNFEGSDEDIYSYTGQNAYRTATSDAARNSVDCELNTLIKKVEKLAKTRNSSQVQLDKFKKQFSQTYSLVYVVSNQKQILNNCEALIQDNDDNLLPECLRQLVDSQKEILNQPLVTEAEWSTLLSNAQKNGVRDMINTRYAQAKENLLKSQADVRKLLNWNIEEVPSEDIEVKYFNENGISQFCWLQQYVPFECKSKNGRFYEPNLINNCEETCWSANTSHPSKQGALVATCTSEWFPQTYNPSDSEMICDNGWQIKKDWTWFSQCYSKKKITCSQMGMDDCDVLWNGCSQKGKCTSARVDFAIAIASAVVTFVSSVLLPGGGIILNIAKAVVGLIDTIKKVYDLVDSYINYGRELIQMTEGAYKTQLNKAASKLYYYYQSKGSPQPFQTVYNAMKTKIDAMRNELKSKPEKLNLIANVVSSVKESFQSFQSAFTEDAIESSLTLIDDSNSNLESTTEVVNNVLTIVGTLGGSAATASTAATDKIEEWTNTLNESPFGSFVEGATNFLGAYSIAKQVYSTVTTTRTGTHDSAARRQNTAAVIKGIQEFAAGFDPTGLAQLFLAFQKDKCPIQYADGVFAPL